MMSHVVREGRGLHSGEAARVTLRRAMSDHVSIALLAASPETGAADAAAIPIAEWTVHRTERGTTIAPKASPSASPSASTATRTLATVEHLFAALAGEGVRRGLRIEARGAELPLLDGGARAWCEAIGELSLSSEPPHLSVRGAAEITDGDSVYIFSPADETRLAVEFRTPDASLEARAEWRGSPADFRARIAPARTFAFASELAWLAERGLAKQVDPTSVVVLGAPGEPALSSGRPFAPDEPARHKLLDLAGDLYLYGGPPRGSIEAIRPGHRATHAVVREALRRGILAIAPLLTLAALLFASTLAHASPYDDPASLPDAPRPVTLPELTHSGIEATVEETLGVLESNGPNRETLAYVQRLGFEYAFASRRHFLGVNYEAAAGDLPGSAGAPRFVSGNTELYGRTVWATRAGLAFGGQLGVILPTATFGSSGSAATTGLAAASMRPWDNAFFNANTVAFRPAIDARAYDKGFVVQARQGIDWAGSIVSTAPRTGLAAVTQVSAGYKFGEVIAVGAEAFELYILHGNVDDASRAIFAVSPSVRVLTPLVQPALSGLFVFHDTITPQVNEAWGVRITFTIAIEGDVLGHEQTAPLDL